MKQITIILLHLGYWLCYMLLIAFLFTLTLGPEPVPPSVMDGFRLTMAGAVLPGLTGFYFFYFRLVPRLLARRNIRQFLIKGVGASMLIGLTLSIAGTLTLNYSKLSYPLTNYKVMQETVAWRQVWLFLGFSFIAGLNGIVSTVLRGFVTWYLEIRVKENLEKEKLQTQLDLLRVQLHPHFLFNTLNNIDMLIQEDTQAASRYLNHLSGLLRFMLYQPSQERVPLAKELQYVQQYLELQKIRTDNKAYFEITITGSDADLYIAPLLFLPFLENAFKYAANKKIPKAISIRFDIEDGQMVFSCRNIYNNKLIAGDQGGLGLQLVRKRLELLYPGKYDLAIVHTATSFDVRLWLNLSS